MTLNKDSSEIREVVQEVLADVLSSLAEGTSPVEDYKEKTKVEKEEEEKNTPKTEAGVAEAGVAESADATESANVTDGGTDAVVATEIVEDGKTDKDTSVVASEESSTAVPVIDVIASPDITVTAIPESTVLSDTTSSSVADPIVTDPVVVEGENVAAECAPLATAALVDLQPMLNEFGINVNCSSNPDGSLALVMEHKGVTRIDTISKDIDKLSMMILIRDFLRDIVNSKNPQSEESTGTVAVVGHEMTEGASTEDKDTVGDANGDTDGFVIETGVTVEDPDNPGQYIDVPMSEVTVGDEKEAAGAVGDALNNILDQMLKDKESAGAEGCPDGTPCPEDDDCCKESNLNPENEDSAVVACGTEEKTDFSNAVMASLRGKYAPKVFEIFELGLRTKNAILAESKDKLFANSKKDYVKKKISLSNKLEDKKTVLAKLTRKYMALRKEREQIAEITGILSSIVNNSKSATSEDHLSNKNARKVLATVRSIVAKIMNGVNTKNFSAILSSAIESSKKVQSLLASEVNKNKKALLASTAVKERRSSNSKSLSRKPSSVKSATSNKMREKNKFNYVGMVSSERDSSREDRKYLDDFYSSREEDFEPMINDFDRQDDFDWEDSSNPILAGEVYARPRSGYTKIAPKRPTRVVVESSYVGRSSDKISGTRYDGIAEMIGEISQLAIGGSDDGF